MISCGNSPTHPPLAIQRGLRGVKEVVGFVTWFLGAVEQFRFFDLTVYACADPDVAVAEVKAEARIKPTGRRYRQEYVVFLRTAGGKIAFLREYFNPVQAARAMDAPRRRIPKPLFSPAPPPRRLWRQRGCRVRVP